MTKTLNEALKDLVPDTRVCLLDVRQEAKSLRGVAIKYLESDLLKLAKQYALDLEVHFFEGNLAYLNQSRAFLYSHPHKDATVTSEALYGETLYTFDAQGTYTRVATARDNYIGWINAALTPHMRETTHFVAVPRGHAFCEPKVEASHVLELSFGMKLRVSNEQQSWSELDASGLGHSKKAFVKTSVLGTKALSSTPKSITSLAKRFLNAPYVWGGTTAWGLDCSGLCQTVFGAVGINLPRDADQQATCGREVSPNDLQEADLLFFPGHVAIALDNTAIIHANARCMSVSIDTLDSPYAKALMANLSAVKRFI